MSKTIIASILAASALFAGAAGVATANPIAQTKTTTSTTVKAAPVKVAATRHAYVRRTTKVTPAGRMVSTRTTTGKAVTYDCNKAGNATKKACK
ncbi:YD repeat-containing protein [Sphingomonas sp. UYAg733]